MVRQWFYQTSEGQQAGPVDSKELRRLAETGIVSPDTLVRPGDSTRWRNAKHVRGLFQESTPASSFSQTAAPPMQDGSRHTTKFTPQEVNEISPAADSQKPQESGEWWRLLTDGGVTGIVVLLAGLILGWEGAWEATLGRAAGKVFLTIALLSVPGILLVILLRLLRHIATRKPSPAPIPLMCHAGRLFARCKAACTGHYGNLALAASSFAIVGTVILIAVMFRGGSKPQPVAQEDTERLSWANYPLAEQIETGGPPIGVSPEMFEKSKNEAKERFEKLPGVTEHQRTFEQLILDWVDDHHGQPLPEQQVMSGWIQEMHAELRRELVASPEIRAVLARMKQIENPEAPEFAALQHEFERLTQQWTLRRMDADKLLAEFDRKYQRWLQDSQEIPPQTEDTPWQRWQQVSVPGVCKFDIPPSMEVQSGVVADLAGELLLDTFGPGPDDLIKRVVIQPRGNNAFKEKAFDMPATVIVGVYRMPGLRNEQFRGLKPADLTKIDELLRKGIVKKFESAKGWGKRTRILEWKPFKIARLNQLNAAIIDCRLQLGENRPFQMQLYSVPFDGLQCNISVAYRESEKSKWAADLEKVVSSFEFAGASRNLKSHEVAYNEGVAHSKDQQWEQAAASYAEAVQRKPDFAEGHHALGVCLAKQNRYEEAVKSYKEAIRLKPENAEHHYVLGIAYLNLTETKDAVAAFQEALKKDPTHHMSLYNLGFAYDYLGNLPESQASFEAAIELKPKFIPAHFNLGVIQLKQGNADAAKATHKKLKEVDREWAERLMQKIQQSESKKTPGKTSE